MFETADSHETPPLALDDMTKYQHRRPHNRAHTHPFLFTLMTLTAAAELGLTAFLISGGSEMWTNSAYRSLLILLCCESAWTLLFTAAYMLWVVDGGAQILASVASSVIWLLLTAILWGAATGFMHSIRTGGDCFGQPILSRCRQSLTVEALGWTEFSLCSVTLIATVLWISTTLGRGHVRSRESRTLV